MASNPEYSFTLPSRPLNFLITGCSAGLGLSLCRAVQAAGHTLIATSRNPSRTPDLVAEVEARGGKWLALDVDSPDAGKLLVDRLEADGCTIDVLVNNAGWSIHHPVEQFTDAEVRDQFETVFFGPYRMMRVVLPYMRRRRFGVVVNVSSGAGIEARESMGVYAGAKAALDGVSKVLQKEVAEFNVRVITVFLGTFRTNITSSMRTGSVPLADDYKGKAVDQITRALSTGGYAIRGDADKAARAMVEVVTGTGMGKGREGETFLPLGMEIVTRLQLARDRYNHAIDVFGDLANSMSIDE